MDEMMQLKCSKTDCTQAICCSHGWILFLLAIAKTLLELRDPIEPELDWGCHLYTMGTF